MPRFLMEIQYVADRDKLLAVRQEHRDYLRKLSEDGVVLAAGPKADDLGGMALFEVTDEAHLQRVIDEDPYTVKGIVAQRRLTEWNIVLGSLA